MTGFDAPLWRALAVFRVAALAYAVILIAHNDDVYRHPVDAWLVAAVMTLWTAITVYGYGRPDAPRRLLLVADLVIVLACVLVSVPIIGIANLATTRTLPGITAAGPVLAWAIAYGRRGAAVAAVIIGAADLSTRGVVNQNTLNSDILLLVAAVAVGHVSRLSIVAQERLARAVEIESATRTRERLARDIHDSVLQVLALVTRRATELGGEAAKLGRLAGEQEAALRALVSGPEGGTPGTGRADLRGALERFASPAVTIAVPATAVELPGHAHDELVAAVASALHNVSRHAGAAARAWVLLEDDTDAVTITVRDDGAGFAADRLDEAAKAGRLGVAQSMRGRITDLGGTVAISSTPGQGTEVEFRIPRQRAG
jgi:signal transduction histidine kinase